MTSAGDESFIIRDSDEEDEDFIMGSTTTKNHQNNVTEQKKKFVEMIPNSNDNEFMMSIDDDKNDRIMTPIIGEAIQRSTMNISRDIPPSDDEERIENDLRSSAANDSSPESEGDYVVKGFRPRKIHVLSDSSEDFNSERENKSRKNVHRSIKTTKKSELIDTDTEDEQPYQEYRKKKPNALRYISDDENEIPTKSASGLSNISSRRNNLDMSIADNTADESTFDDLDMSMRNNELENERLRFHALLDESSDMDISEQPRRMHSPSKNSTPKHPRMKDRSEDRVTFTESMNIPTSSVSGPKPVKNNRSSIKPSHSDSQLIDYDDSDIEEVKKKYSSNKPHTSNNYIDDSSSSDDSIAIRKVTAPKKVNQSIISVDSDSSDTREHSFNESHETAMSLTTEELEYPSALDNITAQKRVSLVCDIKKTESELEKSKAFLESGLVDQLPDKGMKLRLNIHELEVKLEKLKMELKNIPLFRQDSFMEQDKSIIVDSLVPRRKSEIFKRELIKSPPAVKKYNEIKPEQTSFSDQSSDDADDSNSESDTYDDQDNPFMNPFFASPRTYGAGKILGRLAQETHDREQALTVETLKSFHGSLSTRPTAEVKAEDPRGLKIPLMGHQKHALAWMTWREQQKPPGGVLADDMGLGKTLTMISLVMAANAAENSGENSDDEWVSSYRGLKAKGGTLVVCPASLINQWEGEIKKRTKSGTLSVEVFHGNKREASAARLSRNDVVITTYDILSRAYKVPQGTLYKIQWKRAILDEAHIIRNHKSQKCEAVCGLIADKRWALTGTPIQNKELDLYSILKFLKAEPFDDIRVWKRWVDNRNEAGHERLATVMKTLMLRRTKQELMADGSIESLPEKMSEIIWIKMDPEENLVYQKVMIYSKTLFAQFLTQRAEKNRAFEFGGGRYDAYSYRATQFNKAQKALLACHAEVKSHEILVLLLRLRQVCCHPSLIHAMLDQEDLEQSGFDDGLGVDVNLLSKMNSIKIGNALTGDIEEEEEDDDYIGVEDGVAQNILTSNNPVFDRDRQSSKLRAVLNLVDEILEKDDKVIIVSQWTSVLRIVAESLDEIKGASYKTFSGDVAVKDRQAVVDDFNSEFEPRILLLSLTAGGVGLNLVGGNHLILMDIHWNPQLETQAQDRIYRFGQKRNVFIYKILIADSIEERIKALQDKKLAVADSVLSGSGRIASSKLTLDDLKLLFGLITTNDKPKLH